MLSDVLQDLLDEGLQLLGEHLVLSAQRDPDRRGHRDPARLVVASKPRAPRHRSRHC